MLKQQDPDSTPGEGENNDNTDEDIGEILASMSRADALHLLPTAMGDEEGSSILAAPSQSVLPVVDSNADQDTIVGSHANEAAICGFSPSNFTFPIVFLVVLCIEVAGRFVF